MIAFDTFSLVVDKMQGRSIINSFLGLKLRRQNRTFVMLLHTSHVSACPRYIS